MKEAIVALGAFIVILFGALACVSGVNRSMFSHGYVVTRYTHGNTRYIVMERHIFKNDFISHFNAQTLGKSKYKLEVQKFKADKYGIDRWYKVRTIDYGSTMPDVNK